MNYEMNRNLFELFDELDKLHFEIIDIANYYREFKNLYELPESKEALEKIKLFIIEKEKIIKEKRHLARQQHYLVQENCNHPIMCAERHMTHYYECLVCNKQLYAENENDFLHEHLLVKFEDFNQRIQNKLYNVIKKMILANADLDNDFELYMNKDKDLRNLKLYRRRPTYEEKGHSKSY